MHINQPNAFSHQLMTFNKKEHFIILGAGCRRQCMEQRNNLFAVFQIAASQLTDHKRMNHHLLLFQQIDQLCIGFTKMVNPNGCIDQNHAAVLRRGTSFTSGSLPPRAASRSALRRAISASSPMRINAVFSLTPVSFAASLNSASSIFSVVFIHTYMALLDGCVKSKTREIRLFSNPVNPVIRSKEEPLHHNSEFQSQPFKWLGTAIIQTSSAKPATPEKLLRSLYVIRFLLIYRWSIQCLLLFVVQPC